MLKSPGFSSFRELMDIWDEAVAKDDKKSKIKSLIGGQNLIMFFKKGDGVFGAPEESRIVFAKMKSPDEEVPPGWADEANFIAFDLMKALAGNREENMFGMKDLDSIEMVDPDDIENVLMGCPAKDGTANLKTKQDDMGVMKLKDRQ